MRKIKEEFLSTEMAIWRKKALFIFFVALSIFPFYILYLANKTNTTSEFLPLRHFIGIASLQAAAQLSLAWFILKNKVPNFVVLAIAMMAMSFQATFGITVILLAIA